MAYSNSRLARRNTSLLTVAPGPVVTETSNPSARCQDVVVFRYTRGPRRALRAGPAYCSVAPYRDYPSGGGNERIPTRSPGRRLSSWPRVQGPALNLLRWIVVSNRAYIVQDSAIPDKAVIGLETQVGDSVTTQITGLGGGISQISLCPRIDREAAHIAGLSLRGEETTEWRPLPQPCLHGMEVGLGTGTASFEPALTSSPWTTDGHTGMGCTLAPVGRPMLGLLAVPTGRQVQLSGAIPPSRFRPPSVFAKF